MASPQSDIHPPLHGYRGAATPPPLAVRPCGLTVAVSREAGSRGGSVAAGVGRLLGWQVYTPEMLDFLARDDAARDALVAELPDFARAWAEAEFARLVVARKLAPKSDAAAVAWVVLAVAAKGESVVVGRGAGFMLPAATTVHARVVAPMPQRVAYLGQWLRMTEAEAVAEVRSRDRQRAQFLATLTDEDIADPVRYDLVLNSARVGLESAAELIAMAARRKHLPPSPAGPDAVG